MGARIRPETEADRAAVRMLAGLEHARTTASALVAVVGHPEDYPRFGFERASALGLDYPGEAWMALRPGYDPAARGLVAYAPPFAELG